MSFELEPFHKWNTQSIYTSIPLTRNPMDLLYNTNWSIDNDIRKGKKTCEEQARDFPYRFLTEGFSPWFGFPRGGGLTPGYSTFSLSYALAPLSCGSCFSPPFDLSLCLLPYHDILDIRAGMGGAWNTPMSRFSLSAIAGLSCFAFPLL